VLARQAGAALGDQGDQAVGHLGRERVGLADLDRRPPVGADRRRGRRQPPAARGLAAGEVVEELQFLRELLIRNLAPVLVAMRPRQSMAIMLRLNRVIDKGVSVAVVGYTDALVATLFAQNGVPMFDTQQDSAEIERQLSALEQELHAVVKQRRP
jgi:hypothetical protein